MPDPSPLARRVLARLEAVADQAPQPRRLTLAELGAELGLDRRVLDNEILRALPDGRRRFTRVNPSHPVRSVSAGHVNATVTAREGRCWGDGYQIARSLEASARTERMRTRKEAMGVCKCLGGSTLLSARSLSG